MFEHLSLIKENFCHLNSSQLVCMLMMCYYTSMTLPDELLLDTAFSIILIKWYMSINEYKKCRSIMILNMLIAEEGLSRRGFEVTRLNTYTTVRWFRFNNPVPPSLEWRKKRTQKGNIQFLDFILGCLMVIIGSYLLTQ